MFVAIATACLAWCVAPGCIVSTTPPRPSRIKCAAVELAPGLLIEYTGKDGSATLGAVTEADGKKNWKVVAASGNTLSIPPRSVRHVLPGRVTKPANEKADIERHEAAAVSAAERVGASQLEEVWEMVIDDEAGSTLTLVELSELLIGDASSESYYATLRLMEADIGKTFFRSSGKDGPAYVSLKVA